MHIHLLGIGGTFMSALALLARELGHKVTGNDTNCYPPMSQLLADQSITWIEGYEDSSQALAADLIIVGNAIKRGMPVLEAIMAAKKPYTSGPQWLAQTVLPRYRVLAISGTHGKTTTTSMLAFILDYAGLKPSFLIGGIASDFNSNVRLSEGPWFVIEADEYDSAFFDKRPKLMHYRPELAILTNLEFDHADIYQNLSDIQQQFHYYLKTIPGNGQLIKPLQDKALNEVIQRGSFCPITEFSLSEDCEWRAELLDPAGQSFRVWHRGSLVAQVDWSLLGKFNVENALAAIAASTYASVSPTIAAEALMQFTPVKRRLEVKANINGVVVYDDFAHHPTAIGKTIDAVKQSGRHQRILVVLEFASHTMRSGVHLPQMAQALAQTDKAYLLEPEGFSLAQDTKHWDSAYQILPNSVAIIDALMLDARPGDAIVIMSNRGFDDIHQRIISALHHKAAMRA